MGTLSRDLANLGYEPTDRESPFDESGQLWTKGYELVCDETGFVIRKDGENPFRGRRRRDEFQPREVERYDNSGKVKLTDGLKYWKPK